MLLVGQLPKIGQRAGRLGAAFAVGSAGFGRLVHNIAPKRQHTTRTHKVTARQNDTATRLDKQLGDGRASSEILTGQLAKHIKLLQNIGLLVNCQ